MVIEPREAAVVLGVFREFAEGRSESMIVRRLNEQGSCRAPRLEGMVSVDGSPSPEK